MNDSGSSNDPRQPSDRSSAASGSFQSGGQQRPDAKPRRPRRFGYYFKWSVIGLFFLILAAGGTIIGYFSKNSPLFAHFFAPSRIPTIIMGGGNLFAGYEPDKQFPGQHTMNVLILGCDADYVEHIDHPVVVKGAPGRSDSIMVAHIDLDKKTINVLSIPRDTAVPIPGMRGFHKVNAAHSFGGNDLSTRTISQDFGIPIDHTISLDFDSFQKVVDAVHGVDIVVHKPLNYDDNWGNLHVHLKPGPQHLNGYKAMGYVRIRHSDSDLARAERQHEFLEALRAQVKDPSNFFNLPKVANAITDDIKSDLTLDQMLSLVYFATTLQKQNIQLATMEGEEGRSYVYAYPDKGAEIIGKMFFDGNTSAVKLNVASHDRVLAMNGGHGRSRSYRNRKHRKTHTSEAAGVHGATASALPDSTELPSGDTVAPVRSESHTLGNGDAGSDNNSGKGSGDSGGKTDKGSNGSGDGDKKDNARRATDTVFS